MTLALLVEFELAPAHADAFAEAIVRNARLSLTREPGCLQFDVCRSAEEPHRFFLYELYEDEAAIAQHLRAAHYLEFDALTRPWVAAKQVRRYPRLDT